MKLVSEVVGGDHVQQEDVLGLVVETAQSELHLGEDLPEKKK